MSDAFPFVEVPTEAKAVLGEPDPETRIYRAEGPEEESGPWFEAVSAIAGPCVSPGGAGMFAPVTRAAVQKRIKEGRISAFCFHVTSTRIGLFGKDRKVREIPYVYVPASELKAWAEELEERIIRLGRISREELEGRKPDWGSEFWLWEAKWRKERFKRAGKKLES
jgi:hypothetical protein